MKVKSHNVSASELSSEIDLELDRVPERARSKVKRDVGEFLVEQTLLSMSDSTTPVSRAPFKKGLSKEYAEKKRKAGRSAVADLELTGDLKDSLRFKTTDTGIKIGHFDAGEAPKADGHNNFSGDSTLPTRQYLPKAEQKYKRDIQTEIERIVAENAIEVKRPPFRKLEKAQTKTEFWRILSESYEGISRSDLIFALSTNETYVEQLMTLGLLKWLK